LDLDSALHGKAADGAGALEILRDDHAEIRHLIAQYRDARGESEHATHVLVEAIAAQADLHSRIEDAVFYPRVRRLDPDFVDRARRDHDAVDRIVQKLEELEPGERDYADAAEQLVERLLQHMQEEETMLFPQVEQQMGAELGELGATLVKCKEKLTRSTEDLEGPAT